MEKEDLEKRLKKFGNGTPAAQAAVKWIRSFSQGSKSFIAALQAGTGAGKSTEIPPAVLSELWQILGFRSKRVMVTEPRRISVDGLYRHLSSWDKLGDLVASRKGRGKHDGPENAPLLYVTDGWLCSKMLGNYMDWSWCDQYGALILDEVHDRSEDLELIFYMLDDFLTYRDDTKNPIGIILMSATMDFQRVQEFYDNFEIFKFTDHSPRRFEISETYLSEPPVKGKRVMQILQVVRGIFARRPTAGVLVFLPGRSDIEHCLNEARTILASSIRLYGLYRGIASALEDEMLTYKGAKLIASTSIAETGLTIDNIEFVVDSGVTKVKRFSKVIAGPVLEEGPISKAEAHQRAGRGGRNGPGEVFRMYSEEVYNAMPSFNTPRLELSDCVDFAFKMICYFQVNPQNQRTLSRFDSRTMRTAIEKLRFLKCIEYDADLGRMVISESGRKVRDFRGVSTTEAIFLASGHGASGTKVKLAVIIANCRDGSIVSYYNKTSSGFTTPSSDDRQVLNDDKNRRCHPGMGVPYWGDIWADLIALERVGKFQGQSTGWNVSERLRLIAKNDVSEYFTELGYSQHDWAPTSNEEGYIAQCLLYSYLTQLVRVTSIGDDKIWGWHYWSGAHVLLASDSALDFPSKKNEILQEHGLHVIYFDAFKRFNGDYILRKFAYIPQSLIASLKMVYTWDLERSLRSVTHCPYTPITTTMRSHLY